MAMYKVILLLLFFLLSAFNVNAQSVFADMDNISSFKCTGALISGSIDVYNNSSLYYKYIDGKIYSSNLNNMFGDITKKPKKVLRLKITDDYITFKDRLYKLEGMYYAWVKIDRRTGEFLLNAKNDYGVFFKRANVKGVCTIEN